VSEPGVVKRVVAEVSSVVLTGTGTTALDPRLLRAHAAVAEAAEAAEAAELLLPTGMCNEFALDAEALRIGKGDC